MAYIVPPTFTPGAILTAAQMTILGNDILAGGPIYATTAARDAAITAPFAGQRAFVTADGITYQYSGTTWVEIANIGTWSSWTPTLGGGFSNGNATTVGRYLKLGKSIFYWGAITFGTTTGKGAVLTVTIPVAATSAIAGAALISIYGNPAGGQVLFTPLEATTTTVEAVTMTASGAYVGSAQTNATTPATWATGNIVRYGGMYEAATA